MDSKKLYSALYALTAPKGYQHPSLCGVLYKGGEIVISDGSAMAVLKTPYPTEWEGKILDKDGKEIKGPILNYKAVLPYDPQRTLKTSDYFKVEDVEEFKTALGMMPESPDVNGERIGIDIKGSVFYPLRVLKVLDIFEAAEQLPDAYVRINGTTMEKTLILISDQGSIGLVMPLGFPGGEHPNRITMEEALLCGDLL